MSPSDFDFQIIKISKSKTFRKLHDDFLKNPNKNNYNALKYYLRRKFDKKFVPASGLQQFIKKTSLIFNISDKWVFWNSSLDDDRENTFDNYMSGDIRFDNIYQYSAFTEAESRGKSKVIENNKNPDGTFTNFNYVSRKVGSTLTAGTASPSAYDSGDM
jgi:hypothetical protein